MAPTNMSADDGTTSTSSSANQQGPSFKLADYIRTATQNYISRTTKIQGSENLTMKGKSIIQSNTIIHGEYTNSQIYIGRYCYIEDGVVLMPSVAPINMDPVLENRWSLLENILKVDNDTPPMNENEKVLPIVIGSHTHIGYNTRIYSTSVGSCVRIGNNCVLSPRSRVHDCCIIEDNSIVPDDMIIPPFSRFRGNKIVGTLPECSGSEFVDSCVQDYLAFVKNLED